jgi:hypothetical protein
MLDLARVPGGGLLSLVDEEEAGLGWRSRAAIYEFTMFNETWR